MLLFSILLVLNIIAMAWALRWSNQRATNNAEIVRIAPYFRRAILAQRKHSRKTWTLKGNDVRWIVPKETIRQEIMRLIERFERRSGQVVTITLHRTHVVIRIDHRIFYYAPDTFGYLKEEK